MGDKSTYWISFSPDLALDPLENHFIEFEILPWFPTINEFLWWVCEGYSSPFSQNCVYLWVSFLVLSVQW